jgi:hypothetical protein
MDDLKKYLQQQNEEMDLDEPGPLVWEKIAAPATKKQPAKVVKFIARFAAAAAVVVLLIAGIKYFAAEKISDKIVPMAGNEKQPAKIINDTPSTTVFVPQKDSIERKENIAVVKKAKKTDERYALMNSFKESYGQLVNYQLQNIRATPVYAENQAYFNDFKTRLNQMDMDEMAIRKGIRQNGISNSLLEQLINVYQQKLDVLKSLQQEINKMNTRVQQSIPADSLNKFYLNI